MSSIFGTLASDAVTVDGNQSITGKKRFLNTSNEFDGTMVQPTILALGQTIDPTEISFLSGISSNIQDQFSNITIVLDGLSALEQALQALEPAPDALTVQFSTTLILTDNNGIHLDITPDRITFRDDNNGTSSRITATNYDGNANFAYTAGSASSADYATSAATASYATSAASASSSLNSHLSTVSTGVYYPTFSTNTSGDQALLGSAALSYNATTSTLFSANFSGTNFLGNASTASSANTATSAASVNTIVDATTASNCPIGFFTASSGLQAVKLGSTFTCTPSNGTLRATTFEGALTGTASNSGLINVATDNTPGTYYLPFIKTTAGVAKALYVDDTTGPLSYNPSTSTLSAATYTITGVPATANVASTFGQVGLVYLQTLTGTITGTALPVDFNLTGCFNATYTNYRIIITPTTQTSYSAYPSYALKAFLGTGTLPTTASLFGMETTTSNSGVTVAPVYSVSITMATTPLIFAVSAIANRQTVFEVKNVGFSNTAAQMVELQCKSCYSNPGITGASDRTIMTSSLSGAAITGLTLQQTSIGVGNNMGWNAAIYGYNVI